MRILGISGSLRPARTTPHCCGRPPRCSGRPPSSCCGADLARSRPTTKTPTSNRRPGPWRPCAPRSRPPTRADRHARVQRVAPGRAQERARLGLATLPGQRPARQADRGDRRQHRPLRRGLGAGRAAQGARTAGADVLDDELPVGTAAEAFAADGTLRDPAQAHALTAITARLVDRTRSTAVAAGAPA